MLCSLREGRKEGLDAEDGDEKPGGETQPRGLLFRTSPLAGLAPGTVSSYRERVPPSPPPSSLSPTFFLASARPTSKVPAGARRGPNLAVVVVSAPSTWCSVR